MQKKKSNVFLTIGKLHFFQSLNLAGHYILQLKKPNTKARQTVYFTLKKNRSHLNEQLGAKKISFFVNFLFFRWTMTHCYLLFESLSNIISRGDNVLRAMKKIGKFSKNDEIKSRYNFLKKKDTCHDFSANLVVFHWIEYQINKIQINYFNWKLKYRYFISKYETSSLSKDFYFQFLNNKIFKQLILIFE